MNRSIAFMMGLLLSSAITVCAEGQSIAISAHRDFTYPQTPNFVDQTKPGSNGSVDTVASTRKRDRMDSRTDHRERLGITAMIHVLPGGLEPGNEYKLPLERFLGSAYQKGSFSFAGPADALVGITNFAWGTENNNENFLPLLIRADYQDIKTPTLDFSWQMPATYSNSGGTITQTSQPIALNYNFKIPLRSQTSWGDDKQYNRFNAAGASFTQLPVIKPYQMFRWNNQELESFTSDMTQPVRLKNTVGRLPDDCQVSGFAVIPAKGMTCLALSDKSIVAYDENGKLCWRTGGCAPIIVYKDYIVAVTADYQNLQAIACSSGVATPAVKLPDFLPQYENAMATVTTAEGDYLLMSVPQQSRVLVYKLSTSNIEQQQPAKK